jgi:hypothetical protein
MSNVIRNAFRDGKANSLSPEPCALIPSVQFSIHCQLVDARLAVGCGPETARMDGAARGGR